MKISPLGILLLTSIMFASGCSRQSAEEKGKELATDKIDTAKGIGVAMQEKGEAASEALASGVGKVFRGIEKGVIKSGRTVATDASVDTAGLKITTVQNAADNKEGAVHGLDVYILSTAEANGKLRVTMFDVMDKEVGRTSVDLKKSADEGKYHTIPLDAQLQLGAISKVAFEFKPVVAAPKKAP